MASMTSHFPNRIRTAGVQALHFRAIVFRRMGKLFAAES